MLGFLGRSSDSSSLANNNQTVRDAYENKDHDCLRKLAGNATIDFCAFDNDSIITVFHRSVNDNARGRLEAILNGYIDGKGNNSSIKRAVNIKHEEKTPLDMVVSGKYWFHGERFQRILTELLLSLGADPTIASNSRLPQDVAPPTVKRAFDRSVPPCIAEGDLEVALIRLKAMRVDVVNKKPLPPLEKPGSDSYMMLAIRRGTVESVVLEVIKELKFQGEDVNYENASKETSLSLANSKRFTQVVAYLSSEDVTKSNQQITASVTNDPEQTYYQELTSKHAAGDIASQVSLLQKLGDLQLKKKEYKKAAGFFNSALALVLKHQLAEEHKTSLFQNMESVEKQFLTDHQIKISSDYKSGYVANLRQKIEEARNQASVSLKKETVIRFVDSTNIGSVEGPREDHTFHVQGSKILFDMTQQLKAVLSEIIADSIFAIGKAPTEYAFIGMGSMARDEMCPYSDLEFAILVKNSDQKSMPYFRLLSNLIELKIMNMGETPFGVLRGVESFTPQGFSLDAAGNTPLGVPGLYELIGTPEQLAGFQDRVWHERNVILVNALGQVCPITGDSGLVKEYQKLVAEKRKEVRTALAWDLMEGNIKEFEPLLDEQKEQERAFGVKKELYRPFQSILLCLPILKGIELEGGGTLACIDKLTGPLFSEKGASNLKKALELVYRLRVQAHLFYKSEKEILYHPERNKKDEESLLTITPHTSRMLIIIYWRMLPFFKAAQACFRTKNLDSFSNNDFNDHAESDLYAYAEGTVQQKLALGLNNPENLLSKARIENDPEKKIKYAEDALKIIIESNGNGPFVMRNNGNGRTIADNKILVSALIEYGQGLLAAKRLQQAYDQFLKASLLLTQQYFGSTPPQQLFQPLFKGLLATLSVAEKTLTNARWIEITGMMMKWRLTELEIVMEMVNWEGVTQSEIAFAVNYYEHCEKSVKGEFGDKRKHFQALDILGDAAQKAKDVATAIKYFEKASDLFSKLDQSGFLKQHDKMYGTMFGILIDLMRLYNILKNRSGFPRTQAKIESLLLQENGPDRFKLSDRAHRYCQLGDFWRDGGIFDEAVECYEQALLLLDLIEDEQTDEEEASIYNSMGLAYKRAQRYEEAVPFYEKSIAAYKRKWGARPDTQFAVALANYASALLAVDKNAEGKVQLEAALEMVVTLGNTQLEMQFRKWLQSF